MGDGEDKEDKEEGFWAGNQQGKENFNSIIIKDNLG